MALYNYFTGDSYSVAVNVLPCEGLVFGGLSLRSFWFMVSRWDSFVRSYFQPEVAKLIVHLAALPLKPLTDINIRIMYRFRYDARPLFDNPGHFKPGGV